MKHLMKMILPAAAIFLLSACGNNETKVENHDGHDHAATEQEPAAVAKQVINDDGLNAVYEQYSKLTASLVAADMAQAKIAANAIEVGAGEIASGSSIASYAKNIVAANDIEEQRAAFSKLSDDLFAMIKKSGMKEGELYLETCPMAFNDAGASWISASKEIRNPYFGDKMMKCGDVTETVK